MSPYSAAHRVKIARGSRLASGMFPMKNRGLGPGGRRGMVRLEGTTCSLPHLDCDHEQTERDALCRREQKSLASRDAQCASLWGNCLLPDKRGHRVGLQRYTCTGIPDLEFATARSSRIRDDQHA